MKNTSSIKSKIMIGVLSSAIILGGTGIYLHNNSNNDLSAIESPYKVYVTANGEKYHKSGCRYIKDKDVTAYTIEKAESKGYSSCKICKPQNTINRKQN